MPKFSHSWHPLCNLTSFFFVLPFSPYIIDFSVYELQSASDIITSRKQAFKVQLHIIFNLLGLTLLS